MGNNNHKLERHVTKRPTTGLSVYNNVFTKSCARPPQEERSTDDAAEQNRQGMEYDDSGLLRLSGSQQVERISLKPARIGNPVIKCQSLSPYGVWRGQQSGLSCRKRRFQTVAAEELTDIFTRSMNWAYYFASNVSSSKGGNIQYEHVDARL